MNYSAIEIANKIATHDIINTSIYPDTPLPLGDRDNYSFRDAEVSIRRCGNRYGVAAKAETYLYSIVGPNFCAKVRAVWGVVNASTAEVQVLDVGPDAVGAYAYNRWLRGLDPEADEVLAGLPVVLTGSGDQTGIGY